jgi:Flp pilus assembly protein TadG
MLSLITVTCSRILTRLAGCREGGLTVYAALFATVAVSFGTIAVDFGRMTVLRSELQNRADAAALAAAVQLDGRKNAMARATDVAVNAVVEPSGIPEGTELITVAEVRFYSEIEPDPVLATDDSDAHIVEVVLDPHTINVVFQPILNAAAQSNEATQRQMLATAMAGTSPFICHAPPLMMCDLAEIDPSIDLDSVENAGRQIVLKEPQGGDGTIAPGNFGLLALPDGSIGANDIEAALAAVEPEDCYSLDVSTGPGSKTNKVKDGINARFDVDSGWPFPAPNVIAYPQDSEIASNPDAKIGSGDWDIEGYWQTKHGAAPPVDLDNASRYQVYLYELGEKYLRNGRQTIYPVVNPHPPGFSQINPGSPDIPVDALNPDDPDVDGEPSTEVASNGPARRLIELPILECVAENIKGAGTYPTNGRYLEVFITEDVDDPANAAIYGEIVRPLSPNNDADFHANARLVR